MRGMRALRNFKPDRCYHLISRIANRAFYLTDEERTRFVGRLWRVAKFSGSSCMTVGGFPLHKFAWPLFYGLLSRSSGPRNFD